MGHPREIGLLFYGGGGGNTNPTPVYQPAFQGQADTNTMAGINKIASDPNLTNIFNQTYGSLGGIPSGKPSSTGSDPNVVVQTGQQLLNAASPFPAMGMDLYQLGRDPQSALFKQMSQQVSDQSNQDLAARGLAGSPYGSGVHQQALSDFDIQWQNQQLQRALQGAQGAEGAFTEFGNLAKEGIGMQMMGPEFQMSMAQGLGGLASAYLAQDQQAVSDWLQYLAQGTQAASVAVQSQAVANQAQQAETAQSMQMIGMLGSMMGGMGGK